MFTLEVVVLCVAVPAPEGSVTVQSYRTGAGGGFGAGLRQLTAADRTAASDPDTGAHQVAPLGTWIVTVTGFCGSGQTRQGGGLKDTGAVCVHSGRPAMKALTTAEAA